MGPDEMRAILLRLGWSLGDCADRAQRSKARVRQMASGRQSIDEPLADWLRAIDGHATQIELLLGNPPRKESP